MVINVMKKVSLYRREEQCAMVPPWSRLYPGDLWGVVKVLSSEAKSQAKKKKNKWKTLVCERPWREEKGGHCDWGRKGENYG